MPDQSDPAIPLAPSWDWRLLILLLILAGSLRVWHLCRTEVATRDSIRFIRMAWRMENEPPLHAIRTGTDHPAYPLTILGVSQPVRWFLDESPRSWQLSAQIAGSLAGLLLVVPMFFLGKELFDSRIAFWGTLLYQLLPTSGRVLSDGLSDPLFLFFATAALLFAVRGLKASSPRLFALAGLMSGLGYLTRPEGGIVAAVTALVLFILSIRRRQALPQLKQGTALVAGSLVVSLPFMLLIGGLTMKPSARIMVNLPRASAEPEVIVSPLPLAIWNYAPDITAKDRRLWALVALVKVLDKSFLHLFHLPALAAIWIYRRKFLDNPGWLLVALCGLILLPLLYRLGQTNGYVGERHVLFILLGSMFWAVVGILALGTWLASLQQRLSARVVTMALLIIACLVPLPRTLARMHANRHGFRQAGEWLAEHLHEEDRLVDPFAWSSFYAGRTFTADGIGGATYVVLEHSDNKHPHLWYLVEPARELARQGTVVKRFEARRGKKQAEIAIYRID